MYTAIASWNDKQIETHGGAIIYVLVSIEAADARVLKH